MSFSESVREFHEHNLVIQKLIFSRDFFYINVYQYLITLYRYPFISKDNIRAMFAQIKSSLYLSAMPKESTVTQNIKYGTNMDVEFTRNFSVLTASRFRSSTLGYFQLRFKTRSVLPLNELLYLTDELHLLEVDVYEVPVVHLRLFSDLEQGLLVRVYLRCMT